MCWVFTIGVYVETFHYSVVNGVKAGYTLWENELNQDSVVI